MDEKESIVEKNERNEVAQIKPSADSMGKPALGDNALDPDEVINPIAKIEKGEITQATVNAIGASAQAERLSKEEEAQVRALSKVVDIDDDAYVSTFGAKAMDETARFSRQALGSTRVYETGIESQRLVRNFKSHVTEFKATEKPSGIMGFFVKIIGELKWWKRKLQKVTTFADEAESSFRKQKNELNVNLKTDEKAVDVNYRNRRDLIVHIRGGAIALHGARQGKLVELQKIAEKSGSPSDIEAVKDFARKCDNFELKLGRLSTSLAITYMRKPEIDLLIDSEKKHISLFEDLINQAIPLWLDEMRKSMNIKSINQASELAEDARAITEGLFMSNIEKLGEAAEGTVRNIDSGLVRTEVIIAGTDKLLETLEAVEAASKEAIENSRKYEVERAKNNERIKQFQLESIA